MSAKLWTPCIALLLLAASGCERAASTGEFPQAAADGWLGSFNGGDVDGLVLMYSADAQILPPDEPIIAGAEPIREFWKSYGPGQVRIGVSEVDSQKLGDFWLREGSYKAQFPDEGESRVGKTGITFFNRIAEPTDRLQLKEQNFARAKGVRS